MLLFHIIVKVPCFNSFTVQLKVRLWKRQNQRDWRFNSFTVQLKELSALYELIEEAKFQFIYCAIKSVFDNDIFWSCCGFNSFTVQLKGRERSPPFFYKNCFNSFTVQLKV